MYALMSYQFTLVTELLFTHFTSIWALIPMYITGISAFSILYVKLLIHSTLAKTQRLNIRIYSDRKKNNFLAMYTLNKNPVKRKNHVIYISVLDNVQFFL